MTEELTVQTFLSLDGLPDDYANLFERAGRQNFYNSRAWFDNLARTTMARSQSLRIYGVTSAPGHKPLALLVTKLSPGKLCMLEALTAPYTTDFGFVAPDPATLAAEVVAALAQGIAADRALFDGIQLDCLNWSQDVLDIFIRKLNDNGFVAAKHFHFGNWYQHFPKSSFEDYRKTLPSAYRRLSNRVGEGKEAQFRLITDRHTLTREVSEYERLSLLRWQKPEPHPRFIRDLVHAAHDAGTLRFGVLHANDKCVASQIWIVADRKATIFKVAYDPSTRRSAGSTLTIAMMKHLLDNDEVEEVDFGRGDDAYKKLWLPLRRERWGLTAFHARSPRGALRAALLYARLIAKRYFKRR